MFDGKETPIMPDARERTGVKVVMVQDMAMMASEMVR